VWEPNPFYEGPPQPHPEDDHHWWTPRLGEIPRPGGPG
jgi:hypothetical protein